jgi:hypothetical protein
MSDDPDYDPNLDWIPPAKVYGDDVLVDDAGPDGLGRNVPFWKVLLWHTAKARTEMLRNDSAATRASSLGQSDKPPRLAADEEPQPAIDPNVLDLIESKIDELATRMTRLERAKRAEDALLALEDEIERMYPASDDDDEDMALNPRRH